MDAMCLCMDAMRRVFVTRHGLQDRDPYVRKTAAIAVAKLYDMNPELVEERGFVSTLRDMTADAVPMVVSNAVAALREISDISGQEAFVFTKATTGYFVNALDQCTEWGQVYLLECLATQARLPPCMKATPFPTP